MEDSNFNQSSENLYHFPGNWQTYVTLNDLSFKKVKTPNSIGRTGWQSRHKKEILQGKGAGTRISRTKAPVLTDVENPNNETTGVAERRVAPITD